MPVADLLVAYALKTNIVVAVIQVIVPIKNGVKTEAAPLKEIKKTAIFVK